MGKIGIIIKREFNERVRKKSFIITTILTPLLFVGVMVGMFFIMNVRSSEVRHIMVEDHSGFIAGKLESDERILFEPTDKTIEQVKQERTDGEHSGLFGVLVIDGDIMENPRNVRLYTYGPSTIEIESAIASQIRNIVEDEKLKAYDIENLPQILEEVKTPVSVRAFKIGDTGEAKESSSGFAMGLAYIFGFLIYMFVFIYGAMVMQGVIEEKSSKVLEIMVSSVKPFELMMGKILGIATVAITQFLIWVVIMFVAGTAMMHFISPDIAAGAASGMAESGMAGAGIAGMENLDPATLDAVKSMADPRFMINMIGGFLIYFIGGYLLYAAMFAAIGSAVDNAADSQQLQLPVTIPMILAIFVMMSVMREPNSSLALWFSMIPFTSPVIMLARLPYGVPLWELVTSVVILYGTFVVMVWLAGKIYRVGIFMYGKKPTFKELFKWAKYKY